MNLKSLRNIILVLALVILSGGIGYNYGKKEGSQTPIFTQNLSNNNSSIATQPIDKSIDFNLFWAVWNKLKTNYYDKAKIDAKNMYYGAISGMVHALGDDYTVFLTPDQNKDTKEELSGTFEGIGAQLGYKDKKIVVIAPLKDTPAEKAGIVAGDWILRIDNKETTSLTLPEAVSLIRGPKGTKVNLSILHQNTETPQDFSVVRDTILVKSVTLDFKGNIAVLKLSQFGDNSNDEWDRAVDQIVKKGSQVKGVVLDLRNNPGGYLTGSVYIASEFLRNADVVIQEDGDGQRRSYAVNRVGKLLDKPLIVLVNQGSASASEIVAGALQDLDRAKLVGETTFGKGTIQDAEDLDSGAGLHITVAKWLTPKGRWLNQKGLGVDYKVKMDEKDVTKDPQLDKALELLRK